MLSAATLVFLFLIGYAIYSYQHRNSANFAAQTQESSVTESTGDTPGSLADQNKTLQDQVDELSNKLKNQAAIAASTKEIDKKNPALALFAPIVTDKTKAQEQIVIKNITYTPAGSNSSNTVLSFELHNPKPDEGSQKGYIVVVARTEKGLFAYPSVFQSSGHYLLDFEKGETFNIARFRMAHATFDLPTSPDSFQIFLFSRAGELLINELHELKKTGGN